MAYTGINHLFLGLLMMTLTGLVLDSSGCRRPRPAVGRLSLSLEPADARDLKSILPDLNSGSPISFYCEPQPTRPTVHCVLEYEIQLLVRPNTSTHPSPVSQLNLESADSARLYHTLIEKRETDPRPQDHFSYHIDAGEALGTQLVTYTLDRPEIGITCIFENSATGDVTKQHPYETYECSLTIEGL